MNGSHSSIFLPESEPCLCCRGSKVAWSSCAITCISAAILKVFGNVVGENEGNEKAGLVSLVLSTFPNVFVCCWLSGRIGSRRLGKPLPDVAGAAAWVNFLAGICRSPPDPSFNFEPVLILVLTSTSIVFERERFTTSIAFKLLYFDPSDLQ